MKPQNTFYFRSLFLLLIFTGITNNWELKKNKDNISVYTRRITTSDYKELRCSTRVKSSLSSIVKVLTDVNYFTSWIYKCTNAFLIKKSTDSDVYSYQYFDAPWPIEDRDVVARLRIEQDPVTKVVSAHSEVANNLIPEKNGVVRIKKFHSSYILTPLANGWVQIDYYLGTEPGGNIPAWLANLVIVNGPFSTQQMMNELIQSPIFKNARFEFIKEL